MFESWLLMHRETLKHVSLGYLSVRGCPRNGDTRLFNATLFPNLEFLQLSRWQMRTWSLKFHVTDANVLGPRLKTFGWTFSFGRNGPSESWSNFGEFEAAWLRQLAQTAIARNAALETIKVQFSPQIVDWDLITDSPWEWMEDIRDQVLKPSGRNLIFDPPEISKEAWYECKSYDMEQPGYLSSEENEDEDFEDYDRYEQYEHY